VALIIPLSSESRLRGNSRLKSSDHTFQETVDVGEQEPLQVSTLKENKGLAGLILAMLHEQRRNLK
jgi:hypothetical protein